MYSTSVKKDRASILLRNMLLAILYVALGKGGLMLAVPPGYATVIWPPSGLAIGALIVYGPTVAPGILVGSFLLNLWVSYTDSIAGLFTSGKMLAAFGIACGSTLQALAGRLLIKKFLGLPPSLGSVKDAILLLALCGPVACVVAATVGVGCLYASGIVSSGDIFSNWRIWWQGDTLGVFILLPLVLVSPVGERRLNWKGRPISALPDIALLAIVVPLGLTFYGWKITSEHAYKQSLYEFNTQADVKERALINQLAAYDHALLGGLGFFHGSKNVTRQEWRKYVDSINLKENFPGINGIGFIEQVAPDRLNSFVKAARADDEPSFAVHPQTSGKPYYVIKYIEPQNENKAAVGLNIAFEENRLQAAELARDTGLPVMTRRIVLVQDEQKTPGFLMFHPLYKTNVPRNTTEERRAALTGWIYAPVIVSNLLQGLTDQTNSTISLRIYDSEEKAENLIYSSNSSYTHPQFTQRSQINVLQQRWLLVWSSTPVFDALEYNELPLFVLISGFCFSALFSICLSTFMMRKESGSPETETRHTLFPPLIFLLASIAAYAFYSMLHQQEVDYISGLTNERASKIERLLTSESSDRFFALKRMALRWTIAGGTQKDLWTNDAESYTKQIPGLKAVEWVDNSYHIRWIEPLAGNEKAVGLNILSDPTWRGAIEDSVTRNAMTVTPPRQLVQGYNGFATYIPLIMRDRFAGFIVGVFSTQDFINRLLDQEMLDNFSIRFSYNGEQFYHNNTTAPDKNEAWRIKRNIRIHDTYWQVEIIPTQHFVDTRTTRLPAMLFSAGLLISVLLALTAHYILIAKRRSMNLIISNKMNEAILTSTPFMVITTDRAGIVTSFNSTAERLLGYAATDVVGRATPLIWHAPDEVARRSAEIHGEEQADITPGIETFVHKANTQGAETRDWTFIRKDGTRFPGRLTVTPLRDTENNITGYLGIAEDITERSAVEQMKSEFISTVSHELRTPLTSIRGALGLIEGTMAKNLPEKAVYLINVALKNSERLSLLINDILDIEKAEAGLTRFYMAPHNVADLVRAGIEANQAYAGKFKVSISAPAVSHDLAINVDADRWQQIFSNLLSNAIKFSSDGGTVEVSARERDGYVRISVSDKGVGIPQEFRAKIFSKFSQVDASTSRAQGGTGLGLSISKELVTRMGGAIGFDSEPGSGSTFWIEFPRVDTQKERKK